jgi:hypothetical protein
MGAAGIVLAAVLPKGAYVVFAPRRPACANPLSDGSGIQGQGS